MLAAFTKVPELEIAKSESEVLGRGIANVARHYDIGGASEKTLDWFNLFQGLAMVYGPRIFVLSKKRKANKAAQQNDGEHAPNVQQGEFFNGVSFQ